MGKQSPSAPSAAAPFTPESERLRKQEIKNSSAGAAATNGAWKLPTKGAAELAPSQDGMGGSGSAPGYASPLEKLLSKPQNNPTTTPAQAQKQYQANAGPVTRFHTGWDKLLVAQKNICNKAMNLLLLLEAPQKYFAITRSKMLSRKHSGIILDYRSDDERVITQQREAREELERKGSYSKKAG